MKIKPLELKVSSSEQFVKVIPTPDDLLKLDFTYQDFMNNAKHKYNHKIKEGVKKYSFLPEIIVQRMSKNAEFENRIPQKYNYDLLHNNLKPRLKRNSIKSKEFKKGTPEINWECSLFTDELNQDCDFVTFTGIKANQDNCQEVWLFGMLPKKIIEIIIKNHESKHIKAGDIQNGKEWVSDNEIFKLSDLYDISYIL